MRVAIVGNYPLDSNQIAGGVQAAFAYLVKGLQEIDDLDVHILTFGDQTLTGPEQIKQNGVTLHLLPMFPRFELARNFRTYRTTLNKVLAQIRPSVVHAQDATDHAYASLKSGYPTVITVHGVRREDGKYAGALRVRLRNYIYSLLIESYIMRHTRHLIAISHYVSNYYAPLLDPAVQIYYVPNAIDNNFFDPPGAPAGQTILFAGRVIPRKRVLDLVQAFAKVAQQIPSAQLRIAGEYTSEKAYAEKIRDVIRAASLEDQVHLLGPLAEDAVLQEFAACDLLALPSAQETTPMVIAQAMAAAKPVIATPVGGVAEMVDEGKTGFLVNVGDVDGLADALLRLLHDSALRVDMGRTGYQFAVENYQANNVAKRTYEVYQKIASVERVA